jgi:methylated-DNA-[protein]-cysteine S-methyltransferase
VEGNFNNNLSDAVSQLNEYFLGKRNNFTFKLNPKGTDFQQKSMEGVIGIPYGKN